MSRNFPGTDGNDLEHADITTLRFLSTTAWTSIAFFRSEDVTRNAALGISKWRSGTERQCLIDHNTSGEVGLFHNAANRIRGTFAISADTWYLVAGTCDGAANLKLYLIGMDGTVHENLSGTTTGDSTATHKLRIGNYVDGSDNDQYNLDGDEAYVAYIDAELSLDQIKSYLVRPYRTFCQFGGQAFMPLVGSSPEVDWSGNANNFTVEGTLGISDMPPVVGPIIGFDHGFSGHKPFVEELTADRWYQPLELPVIERPQTIGEFVIVEELAAPAVPELSTWYQDLEVPIARVVALDHQAIEQVFEVAPEISSWYQDLSLPEGVAREGVVLDEQLGELLELVPDLESWYQDLEAPHVLVAGTTPVDEPEIGPFVASLDTWYQELELPRVAERRFDGQEPELIEPFVAPVSSWYQDLDEPQSPAIGVVGEFESIEEELVAPVPDLDTWYQQLELPAPRPHPLNVGDALGLLEELIVVVVPDLSTWYQDLDFPTFLVAPLNAADQFQIVEDFVAAPVSAVVIDREQVIKRLFDHTETALRMNLSSGTSVTNGTKLDWGQVVKEVFRDGDSSFRAIQVF